MRKLYGATLGLSIVVGAALLFSQVKAASYNYPEVLLKATAWFDANRCGSEVATDNIFSSWRSACHTTDSVDGGFHDAGDHVKFGLPAAFAASALGWSFYEFESEYDNAGATTKVLQELKIFSDYFLKCWTGSSFVYQIGDGGSDHSYWGPPESQTTARPASSATSSAPASDVCGQTAGALALMYLNYKSTDATYANKCLSAAKELFTFAKTYLGAGSAASGFYSSSSYYDDLAWGAIWLYAATAETSYLELAVKWANQSGSAGNNQYQWTYCWDDCSLANWVMLYKLTGNQNYYQDVAWNFNWYANSLTKTAYGLPYLTNWAVLRYAAAESGLMYIMYKNFGLDTYNKTANLMIDYCLGDNPKGLSYITNYGGNAVKHPHHRANEPVQGGTTHGMVGALVGGPDSGDGFSDDVTQYVYTEVALDYNASFLLGCAGRSYVARGGNGGTATPTASATVTVAPTMTPSATVTVRPTASATAAATATATASAVSGGCAVSYTQNDWGSGATISITIKNNGNTAINGWSLAWEFAGNQKITNLWGGTLSQNGTAVTVSDASYNANIPAGGVVTFGFNLSYSGSNPIPTGFTLNGADCEVN